jgi:DNA (cytosine-5)-methyltransferase 1
VERVDEPLRTVTSGNHAAAIEAHLSALVGPAVWAAFNHVYAFLLEHVGPDAPLPLVTIDGQVYLIVDVGMRMLVPRELARAQGFDEDYVLTGTAAQQVARIGNSVSPPVAEALVRANCGEVAA